MPRNPYHQLAQLDDEDDDDVDEKFSLLSTNKNEPKKTSSSNLSPDIGLGIELRSRNAKTFDRNSPSRLSDNSSTDANTVFIERKIKKGDSLRNLALQYGISVQYT